MAGIGSDDEGNISTPHNDVRGLRIPISAEAWLGVEQWEVVTGEGITMIS
jgi:hypothetical protein